MEGLVVGASCKREDNRRIADLPVGGFVYLEACKLVVMTVFAFLLNLGVRILPKNVEDGIRGTMPTCWRGVYAV